MVAGVGITANDILAWHDFFGIVAQVGATLAGLIFVGLTISLPHILKADGYLSRAFAALFVQLELLAIGVIGLIPYQHPIFLGAQFIGIGLALSGAILVFSRNFREDENSSVLGSRRLRIIRGGVTALATLSPVASGALLIAGFQYALYFIVPGVLAASYLSIGYAWVFAVEIPRRMDRKL